MDFVDISGISLTLIIAGIMLFVTGASVASLFFDRQPKLTLEDHEQLREFIKHEVNMHLFEKQQDKLFTSMNDIIFERDKDEE